MKLDDSFCLRRARSENPLGWASEVAQYTAGKTGVRVRESDSAGVFGKHLAVGCGHGFGCDCPGRIWNLRNKQKQGQTTPPKEPQLFKMQKEPAIALGDQEGLVRERGM